MKKKVSIYDIAKYSNVSPAAVSYVINGVNKVSLETRTKVLAAIDELGYVPDHNARSLLTGNKVTGAANMYVDASSYGTNYQIEIV